MAFLVKEANDDGSNRHGDRGVKNYHPCRMLPASPNHTLHVRVHVGYRFPRDSALQQLLTQQSLESNAGLSRPALGERVLHCPNRGIVAHASEIHSLGPDWLVWSVQNDALPKVSGISTSGVWRASSWAVW